MKKILSIALIMTIVLGVKAIANNGQVKNESVKEYKIDLLNGSLEYKKGKNDFVEMSSAFMVTQNNTSNELFGSFWAEFNYEKGDSEEIYTTKNWNVTDIRLGDDLSTEELKQVEIVLQKELKASFKEISKSSLNNALNSSKNNSTRFNSKAPLIFYANAPSILVIIDGDPFYESLDNRYKKITNANSFIIKDGRNDTYYLNGAGYWFTSKDPSKDWKYQDKVPNRVKRIMKTHARDLYDSLNEEERKTYIIPKIIVSTEPSELISTHGKPKLVMISQTNLAYVENTDTDLFMDINTEKYYSLFSGRWFTSDRLEGDWVFVAPGPLPGGFAKIPEEHVKSSVLASVPGTNAAVDAVRDAQVPFVVKRDISTLLEKDPNYDGEPEFVEIKGTDLMYAVNTSYPVIKWNNRYYLVEDATWYNSSSPHGVWGIATKRPPGVENIPADNPLFNLKYVYIYKQDNNDIYTGYTSGYTGSYVDDETVVYGTGHQYQGSHGTRYYHHHVTYGFGFFYDPFYGWGPYYSPWFRTSFYWHWHWRPWYGYRPPFYRPPYYRPPGHRPPGYRPPGHRPPHHRPPGNRPPGTRPPGNRPPTAARPEQPIYRPERPGNLPSRPSTRPVQPSTRPVQPSTRPSQPSTRPVQPSTRPSQPSTRPVQPSTRPSQPSVRPVQPSARPSRPAARPSQPSMRPGQPAARPGPSMRPSQPANRPSPGPMRMR